MAQVPKQVVIRTYAPARRWIVVVGVAFAVLLGAYGAFEYGRYSAGFDRLEVLRQTMGFEKSIEMRDARIAELQRQSAELETLRASQTREREEVARTIGSLQAQVAKQTQELAFYKGIVEQSANAPEVKVQQLRISALERPGRYRVRVMLVQPVRPENIVSGRVMLVLEGQRQGKPEQLDLGALTNGASREITFSFRYFENLDPEIVIPSDFQPERITVEVKSNRRGVTPAVQTYLWTVEAV